MLVERTVEDVIPNLQTNAEGLKKVLEDLVKTYKKKEQELDAWKASLDPRPQTTRMNVSLLVRSVLTCGAEEEQDSGCADGLRFWCLAK